MIDEVQAKFITDFLLNNDFLNIFSASLTPITLLN